MHVISRLALILGLVPLIWLVGRAWWKGEHAYAEWWLLACAYGVSWMTDTAAQYVGHALSANAYPLLQCGLLVAILLPKKQEALAAIGTMALTGMASVLAFGPTNHVVLHTVAWLTVVGLAWQRPQLGPLRAALLTTFGLGWLAWMGFQLNPVSFVPWIGYQVVRAVGTALLCRAMTRQSSVQFG